MDPVPDPLLLRKSGSAGNRNRDLCICSQKLWPLDHRGGLIPLLSSSYKLQVSVREIRTLLTKKKPMLSPPWRRYLVPGDWACVPRGSRVLRRRKRSYWQGLPCGTGWGWEVTWREIPWSSSLGVEVLDQHSNTQKCSSAKNHVPKALNRTGSQRKRLRKLKRTINL